MEKKFVNLKNGERYAFVDEGQGEVLLLLHGNLSSSLHFLPLLKRLPKTMRIVAPDLRGFGDSSYNNRFDSLGELAEDVKQFADALKIEKAHLVGWSTGGGIALELAARHPNFVKSIFSIEGVGVKGYPIFKKNADKTATNLPYANKEEMALDPIQVGPGLKALEDKNGAFFEYLWNLTLYARNKPSAEEHKLFLEETLKQRCLLDLDWALARFNMSFEPNAYGEGSGAVARIKCPCLFTTADADFVVPASMVLENYGAVENSILTSYKDCGHSPLLDCPDKLVDDLMRFVTH